MDVITQTPQVESKDIKVSKGKITDSKSEEGKDFFENIISGIISESKEGKDKSFLLSKLLNLSNDFEKKEQTLSQFSQEPLFNDHQIGQVPIQDLLKIAMKLKNGEDVATFPTDSKTLKLALLKPEIAEQFKSAKNIKELLNVAKKNNIEVKNFQFFSEAAALDPKEKKMVQKINSEDIFKLIEKQLDTKAKLNVATLANPQEAIKQNDSKITILQSVLASKEIIRDKDQQSRVKSEKEQTIVNRSKESTLDIKTTIKEVKEVTTNVKTTTGEIKEAAANIKTTVTDVKENKSSKIVIEQRGEVKDIEPLKEGLSKKIIEPTREEMTKPKELKKSTHATLNLQKTVDTKETQTTPLKKEISPVAEKVEVQSESTDKTTVNNEARTQSVEKTKNSPDVKRTFSTFAEEFKEKVENYKPPLMKIKMELKPAGLGDVDVTLLNRGNNLQVNINSNTNTIAMFMQNQTEFKNSLINMGFSDLQMNFSEQQKKEQDAQNQKNGKNVFEQLEENEEQDGFEMIIPRYV